MRLRRIVAGRFGALEDADLGDLGDGLTVVVGPNESGKTSFTALIRHVLYGFPPRSTSEKRFDPPDGDARGALVFEDERGRYTLERHMSAKAKTSGALGLAGPDGPQDADVFVRELSSGLSRDTYRSVFGFSIEELARIDTLADIKGSLFASAAGLSTDPHEALETIVKSAGELWSPRTTRKTRIRELAGELRDLRSRAQDARGRSAEASGRRGELEHLASILPALEETARAADEEARTLAFASDTLAAIATEQAGRGETLGVLRDKAAEASAVAARIVPDPLVLASAGEIDGVAQRLARFEDDVAHADECRARARAARTEAERLLAAVGAGPEIVDIAPPDTVADGAVSSHDERLRAARTDADRCAESLHGAEAVATRRRAEADDSLRAAGLDPADAASWTEAAARSHAVTSSLAGGAAPAAQGWPSWLPLTLGALGVAAAAVGALVGQWIAAGLGIAVAATGIALLALGPSRATRSLRGEPDASTSFLGDAAGDRARTMDTKQRLDVALQRNELARQAEEEAHAAAARSRGAEARFDTAQHEWSEWATAAGLAAEVVPAPSQARPVLLAVRDARRLLGEAEAAEAEADGALDRATAFSQTVERVSEAAGLQVPPADGSLEETSPVVRDLQRRADDARSQAARRAEADLSAQAAADAVERAQEDLEGSVARRRAVLENVGLPDDASAEQLLARAGIATDRATEALGEERGARDRLKELEGALGNGGPDEELERLALQQVALEERISVALDEYAVEAMAARLLDETLAAWERDRQPEVLQRARELLTTMTDGAYTGLVSPVGTFAPTVIGAAGTSRTSDRLSRGTAEQLYLAVRIAYIEANLGSVSEALPVVMDDPLAEFDEVRREQTASAIAGLARHRQVVLFTCHTAVAEAFDRAAPDHTRLVLGRCRS